MQKNQVDQTLAFKKRARRRLVGAIALVFLMVIILPMVLKDREAAMVQEEEIEITMPDQDIMVDEGAKAIDEGNESTVTEVVEEPPVKAEVIDLPKAEPQPEPVVKPKAPAAVVEEAKEETSAPAEPTKKETKTATATGKFYVQIGVFSEMANVKKLQSRLNDLGYQSVTENVTTDKGVKTRLRTVAFDGRNEAAIALENIKDSGLTGMVVSQK